MGETSCQRTSEHLNARDEILRSIDLHQKSDPHDAALRRRSLPVCASIVHALAFGGGG